MSDASSDVMSQLRVQLDQSVYETLVPEHVIQLLTKMMEQPEPIVHFLTRGKNISSYVTNLNTMRTAFFLEQIEPELLDWIDAIPEDSVLYDLGASNGPFSIYAAHCGIRVFAFEPEAQNFSTLERNHFLNRDALKHPIASFNVAISDVLEVGKMFLHHHGKAAAGAHEKILDAPKNVLGGEFTPAHIQAVMKFPLDRLIELFALPTPEYLKIDVDGSERMVIAGAQKTLSNKTLRSVFIELTETEEGREVISALESFGFSCTFNVQVEEYVGLMNYVFSRKS